MSDKESIFKMTVKIEKVNNGFILTSDEGVVVIEENENKDKDCEAIQRLLYAVLEAFGELGSKHDPERIRIEVQRNPEYEAQG